MALPYIIVNGRLTEDPVVKEVNGETVLNYRVASNLRKQNDSGEWVDVSTTYLDGSIWGPAVSNATFKKGDSVIITGTLKQRSYENDKGEKRTVSKLYNILYNMVGSMLNDVLLGTLTTKVMCQVYVVSALR